MKKAQISTEYMIVMAFIFLVLAVLLVLYARESYSLSEKVNVRQAYQISKTIADAADRVYYTGKNSKITIKANFPDNIQEATVGNNEILLKMRANAGITDAFSPTQAPVQGALPATKGLYQITIKSEGDYVSITYK